MKREESEPNEVLVARYQAESDHAVKCDILGTLYQNNINLVKKLANRYCRLSDIDIFSDLMQEGYFALMNAADVYDTDQETAFATYCVIWLRQTMLRYIYDSGTAVRYPVRTRTNVFKLSKIINQYSLQFGREPSDRELCALLDIDQAQLEKLKLDNMRLKVNSLDAPIQNEDADTLTIGDTVADNHNYMDEVIEIEDNARLSLVLWDEVSKLSADEETVIVKRFRDSMTLNAVGSDMNITADAVRLIQAKAMRKLRQSKIIKVYHDDIVSSRAYLGTGLQAFLHSGSSNVERICIDKYDREMLAYIKELEQQRTARG